MSGFCEKLLEASPMSDRPNASWLQDGPVAGQGRAHQQWWKHLCDNIFKKGKKKTAVQQQPERGVRICESNNSADTKVSEGGGGRGAPGTGAEVPLQPMEKTMVRQAVPLQPMEVDGEADIYDGGPRVGAGGRA